MTTLINTLLNTCPEEFIAQRVQPLLDYDAVFQKDNIDLSNIESKIIAHCTGKAMIPLLYDYIACANSRQIRAQEVSYTDSQLKTLIHRIGVFDMRII